MDNLKLIQLAMSEFKVDSVTDFCLNSNDNNLVLWGNCPEFQILEMSYSSEMLIHLPYHVRHAQVSPDKPLLNLIRPVDLVKIYLNCSVLETQELALDPIYVAECSIEAPKPRLLQTELVASSNFKLCCILTTYGACEVLQKDYITQEWKILKTNLSKILITDVFPIKKSPTHIRTFQGLRDFIDVYIITSFAWSQFAGYPVIYLGTAVGYVVALKYLEETREFVQLFSLKTSLARIAYMTTRDNLMVVGCNLGQVRLLKIDQAKMTLTEMDYLWSKTDRMACRKALINYSEQWQSYFVVFCKAAHILVYRIKTDGSVMSNSTLYVSGIKISGLESVSANEFIISTIMCAIKFVRISCPSDEELSINTQPVDHELDAANLQILGIAISKSRNLWSFLLSRNKDYTHQSKYTQNTTFLSVCKINNQDSLTKLINLNLTTMDMAKDLVLAINLDIINNFDSERYYEFLNLNRLNCPKVLNDAFLQKLQIKLIIVRNVAKYQKMKYKGYKRNTEAEMNFLEAIVQLVYILGRLQYLQTVHSPDIKMSSFQELSVACMQTQFIRLLNGLVNTENEENPLRNTTEHFAKVITEEFEKCRFHTDSFKYKPELCWMCNGDISMTTFDKCRDGHEVKRCTVSYLKIPMCQAKYCPHCFALVTNDNAVDLQELFTNNEFVKCTFCRFLLREETF